MAVFLRLALLPFDLLRLTFDFMHLTEWHVARGLAGMIGVTGPSSGPFCSRRVRGVDLSGKSCAICLHARRYTNTWLFRTLCRWVIVEPVTGTVRACVCRRRRSYRAPLVRYASVGAAIGLVWAMVWRGALHWMVKR